jgi:hypothetical protein
MALVALDMRHKTNPAGIMLVGACVQTVLFKMLNFSSRGHGNSLSVGKQKASIQIARPARQVFQMSKHEHSACQLSHQIF